MLDNLGVQKMVKYLIKDEFEIYLEDLQKYAKKYKKTKSFYKIKNYWKRNKNLFFNQNGNKDFSVNESDLNQ